MQKKEYAALADLESARALTLSGDQDKALEIVDRILLFNPSNIDGLRLKGNILEEQALSKHEASVAKLMSFKGYLAARNCYQKILEIDPRNTVALLDLGDHYMHLDAFDHALSYYAKALSLLEEGEYRHDWRDEVEDLLERSISIVKHTKSAPAALALQNACGRLLATKSSD